MSLLKRWYWVWLSDCSHHRLSGAVADRLSLWLSGRLSPTMFWCCLCLTVLSVSLTIRVSPPICLRVCSCDCQSLSIRDCRCVSNYVCLIVWLSLLSVRLCCLSDCVCPSVSGTELHAFILYVQTVPALSPPPPTPPPLSSHCSQNTTVCVRLKIVVRQLTQRMWGRNYNLSQLYWLDRRSLRRSKQLLKYPANTEALHISNQSSNPVNVTLIKVK